ncbi:sensor histidine kinase KdpD [Prevotella sp. P6B4]|uniref:sensor histidine kinase n=1 Tax=Prevotella sp. P6B4 TaxID=1410614 RepID=UPI00048C395B|nr:HAMP domain-containing sensor histidine kinase [Prevotella sp. P6B4]
MDWYWIINIVIIVVLLVSLFLGHHYYRKRLNKEISRAQRSERIKTVFLANVSHALRSPLNTIIKTSDELSTQSVDDMDAVRVINQAKHINKNGHQLLYFISQLLELSNFESSMGTFTMIEVNLAELMASYRREALRDVNSEVSIVVRSPLSPHCKATLDTNLMYQLMMHLLHNATQHTKEGLITLNYEYERRGLKITVTDTGDGMPQKLQNNLSSMFQMGDSLNLFNQSSGLGLSICKAIVDSLNGQITLNSEPAKGTTVTVWLPCAMRHMKKGL